MTRTTTTLTAHVSAVLLAFSVVSCGTEHSSGAGPDVAKSSVNLLTKSPFADGFDKARVQVQLVDTTGRGLSGRVVEFRMSGTARIDQPGVTDGDGRAWATIDTTVAGKKMIQVVVDPGSSEVVLVPNFEVEFLEPPSASVSTLAVSRSTAPANGETLVTVTATCKDGGGGLLSGHEVRIDCDDPLAIVTAPVATTNGFGIVTATVKTLKAGLTRISATVNPNGRPLLVQQQPTITFTADALVPDDGEIVYGEASLSTPRLRSYSKSSGNWAAEQNITAVSTTTRWVVDAFSPTSNHERLSAVLSEDGSATKLSVLRQIGDGWGEAFVSTSVPFAHVDKRGFDLAFEDLAGDALVVWSDGSSTLRYRHKTGGTWSADTALPINDGPGPNPDLNTGVPLWVELVERPDSNEIALAYVDTNATLAVLVWDGAIWTSGSATVLSTNATKNAVSTLPHNRGFDLAYESTTDALVAAWGEAGVAGFRWSRRDPTSGTWSTAVTESLQNGAAEHLDLSADPSSNRVAIACYDLGGTERLGLAMWNGASWVQGVEIDSQIRDVNHSARSDWPGEVAWVGTTGVAICIYPDNSPARIDWCRYTVGGGWTLQSPVGVSGKGFTESAVLREFQTQNTILAAFSDSYGKLWAARYDGSSWTVTNSASPLETTLSTSDGRGFDYQIKQR